MKTSASTLATSLVDLVDQQLDALAAPGGPLPRLALPGMLMGHEVGPDVRADLLFTLGLLYECGRTHVGEVAITDAVPALLRDVSGQRTHTFYSYRVAETVARFGAFDANPVLASLTAAQRREVASATDTTDWLPALDDGRLPRNYAAVLARCEHARRSLGLAVDDSAFDALLARVRNLLGGYLDDSNAQIGRYDVYTVDVHLFCEPLAALIGDRWRQGALKALDLVDRVASLDGTAVAWGRSTGVLAICHTIELAGLVARHDLVDDAARWTARAARAAAGLDRWFEAGWVSAHQHRSSDPYRGLDRRLQMTLDCLGKLADAASALGRSPDTAAEIDVDDHDLFSPRDEMVWFDESRRAGVWSFRDSGTAFVLPLVGGSSTDYLPAPRNPGLHEVPVGSALATGSPLVFHKGVHYAGGGLPEFAEHTAGVLRAHYDGFPEAGQLEPGAEPRTFAGTREVTWTVEGRTLRVRERLRFPKPPHALGLQVAEPGRRPLRVDFACEVPHTTTTIEVDGIAEYRSCWSELARVHQVDISPTTEVNLEWTVTPMLRVASTAAGHLYGDSLYGPIADRVRVARVPYSATTDPRLLDAFLPDVDQFHMHWPEWMLIGDVGPHRALIDGLRRSGVRIVWTQHNLEAHSKDPTMRPVYEAWARAADLVIHHSAWGKRRALATYAYGDHTRHVVIVHGHFGDAAGGRAVDADRIAVEHDLGLRTGVIRIGIFGAPRAEKDVGLAMRAVARCSRSDIELLVLSLGDEVVPDDPRIVAFPYETVPREEYDRRLGAVDALLMPFDPDGQMLTTGTIGDALGFGIPTIASSWPFLVEALGDAAIVYGASEDDLVTTLERLDRPALDATAAAARALRPSHEWSTIAEQTYVELDRLGSERH